MVETDKREFYELLTEGSELLQAGRVDDARARFERALQHNPTHEQALNLLGLTLFRLNQLDRARQIFAELVHNNPIEPSLRLNLAMVQLKTGKYDDARVELERVLELNPDHPRATSYMGLVLEKKGDLDGAASFYERAGNRKRADEIRAFRPTATGTFPLPNLAALMDKAAQEKAAQERAAQGAPEKPAAAQPGASTDRRAPASATPSAPPARAAVLPVAPPSAPPPAPQASATSAPPMSAQAEALALTAASAQQLKKGGEAPSPAAVESVRGASLGFTLEVEERRTRPPAGAATTPPQPVTPQPGAGGPRTEPEPPALENKAPSPSLRALPSARLGDLMANAIGVARAAGSIEIEADGRIILPITDVGYVRTDVLLALAGAFEVEPVNRRYRGKRTDSLFGGAETPVVALLGRGVALVGARDLEPRQLELKSEEVYLVESVVLAFGQGLVWENGRLPSPKDRDLDIVHLRGSGTVIVGSGRRPRAFEVRPDQPVVVHAGQLMGWMGQLVPHRGSLPGLPESAQRPPIVRFEGTGLVFA